MNAFWEDLNIDWQNPEFRRDFIRSIQAQAWDEGFDHCQVSRHTGHRVENPYRSEDAA